MQTYRPSVSLRFVEYQAQYAHNHALIDLRDTRAALTMGLSMCDNGDWASDGAPRYGVFRMYRVLHCFC